VSAERRLHLADFDGLPPLAERHYRPMDLFAPVPPVDWVVDNVVVAGEATLLAAPGGAGKSYFALALSLAVAGGQYFLDNTVHAGRVTYVDEEGSPALALQRLQQLGASAEQRQNLDYLNFAGVDMARKPDDLIEDVMRNDSVLVVLDSYSKVARGAEENSNDAMTSIWNEGILRLARMSGAAVLVIHHTNARGGIRGATSIVNSADQVLSMVKQEDRSKIIYPSKPRRRTHRIHFRFQRSTFGGIELVPVYDYPAWE
jgi:RecA-family ATPase